MEKFSQNKHAREQARPEIGGRHGVSEEREKEVFEFFSSSSREFEKSNPEIVEKIKDLVNRIDKKEFKNVFVEMLSKAGVPLENVNFPFPYNVLILGGEAAERLGTLAGYVVESNTFLINGDIFAQVSPSQESNELIENAFFYALFHEYAHAIAKISQKTTAGVEVTQTGFDINTYNSHDSNNPERSFFRLFNEGFTEIMGQAAAGEYFKRNPLTLPDGRIFNTARYENTRESMYRSVSLREYRVASLFVKWFVRALSQECEVPPTVAWNGLLTQAATGQAFFGESKELLEEIFGEGFLDALASAETPQKMDNVLKKYMSRSLRLSGLTRKKIASFLIPKAGKSS